MIVNHFASSTIINTKEIGFKFAWGVETTYGNIPMQDPNQITWVAELSRNGDDSVVNSTQLTFHLCTDDDYDSFYKPADDYLSAFSRLQNSKTLYCIDDDQTQEIYGGSHAQNNQIIEMIMLPCQALNSTQCNTS